MSKTKITNITHKWYFQNTIRCTHSTKISQYGSYNSTTQHWSGHKIYPTNHFVVYKHQNIIQ